MTTAEPLTICEACGTELEVAEGAQSMRCPYCWTELEIGRDPPQAPAPLPTPRSEPVAVAHRPNAMTSRIDLDRLPNVVALRSELDRLERAWKVREKSFMVTHQGGRRVIPSRWSVLGYGALMTYVVWDTLAYFSRPGDALSGPGLVGMSFIVVMMVITLATARKALGYRQAKAAMLRERAVVLARIDAAKDAARKKQARAE